MGKTGATGLTRVWNAFFYSLAGIRDCWKHEAAFRQECLLSIILFPVAFWVGDNITDYVLLIACLFIVLITELMNSAVEAIVDRVSMDHHALSGRSKDMASAAVLFSILMTVFVWGAIAWKNYAHLL